MKFVANGLILRPKVPKKKHLNRQGLSKRLTKSNLMCNLLPKNEFWS